PRTVEVSAGMLHALGLPNPGMRAFVSETLPSLRRLGCPVLVSILGENRAEWARLAKTLTLAGGIAGLELNLSLADLRQMERESEALARIAEAVQAARTATPLPLIAKLPTVGAEIGTMAQVAEQAGADAIAVAQA